MKTLFRSTSLVIVLMMCFLLPAFAAADTVYDQVIEPNLDEDVIYISADLLDQNVSYELDGRQIAEWIGSTRTLTVKGPLNLATRYGFVRFDTPGFNDRNQNSATMVFDGHVSLEAEEGHCIDAWADTDEDGNPLYDFELILTSKGYNAETPSASTSSLSITKTGADCNGIQAYKINVKDLYIKELHTDLIGMFNMGGMNLTNTTIDSARSNIGCVLEGAGNADTVLDNVTIHSITSTVNAISSPGTLTIRDSQISNLSAGEFGLLAEREVIVENSSLTNASSGIHLITTFAAPEDAKIEIRNSQLSSLESEGCIIFSSGNITASNSKVDDATSNMEGCIVSESKATVTNSTFNNVTTTNEYIIHGLGEDGVVVKNSTLTNCKAIERGAALGGAKIQLESSAITNYTGENIVSCSGDISIKDSTLQGITTWSSVWAGGDLAITNTTLTATSTEEGAPGLYTDTGNFTLDGIAAAAPVSPIVTITPPSASAPAASVPQTGDNTPLALLSVLMVVSLVLMIHNRRKLFA